MNTQWQVFLTARGALINADNEAHFPSVADHNAASQDENGLFDLSHLGLIRVQGADAQSFLQGQLTNDVRELTNTHTQLSSYCSPKGRMLANFRVMRLEESFILMLPRERLADTIQRLRMFVLRAQVTLEDVSDTLARFGIVGEIAAKQLQLQGLTIPLKDGDLATTGEVNVLRLPAAMPRFAIIGLPEPLMALWDALASEVEPRSPDQWALQDIRSGIPTVYKETVDAFVPQMTNMQLIDGVSFTKGCYTGQEIVARMQYLGKLKRRMYLAEVESDVMPKPGDELHAPGSSSVQANGRIVDARAIGSGRYALLAVVEIDAAQSGEVHLGEGGPILRFQPPPYGFPAQDAA